MEIHPTNPNAKLLYTVAETMETLGIGRTTLYGLFARGELKRVWIGRSVRVTFDSILALIARQV